MMRITDAGEPGVTFQCPRCQRETDWIDGLTTTQAKHGLPCPDCNPNQEPLPQEAVERSLTSAPRYAERVKP